MRGTLTDGVYFKKEKESGKIRFCNGWSINLDEIDLFRTTTVQQIVYATESGVYTISSELAKEKGFVRVMKGERKLIVPLKYWTLCAEKCVPKSSPEPFSQENQESVPPDPQWRLF